MAFDTPADARYPVCWCRARGHQSSVGPAPDDHHSDPPHKSLADIGSSKDRQFCSKRSGAVKYSHRSRSIGRREFLKNGALAGIGLGLALADPASASVSRSPQVRRYSPLGRTGMHISDISFGSDRLSLGQEDLVHHALDRGINYFDTADDYRGGESETTLGKALHGKRNDVFIASKSTAWPETRKDAIMQALEGSLRRLQTDHVDVYFNHAVNDLARLKNPEWYEFAETAKKHGKLRFTGMSGT